MLAAAARSWGRNSARLAFGAHHGDPMSEFADLQLLLRGIKLAVLIDYPAPPMSIVIESLRAENLYHPHGPLALLEISNFTFVVNVTQATSHLLSPSLELPVFLAIDANYGYPERLSGAQELALRTKLVALRDGILFALRTANPLDSRPLVIPTNSDEVLPSLAGWLLCYPVVYCFVNFDKCGGKTCLANIPLHAVSITARAQDGVEMEVLKYTVPEKHWTPALGAQLSDTFQRLQAGASPLELILCTSSVTLDAVAI